jgi:inner membrane protein involved in colicin E2 resistance
MPPASFHFLLRDRRARLAGLEAAVLGVVCGVLNVILRLENCVLAGAAILFTALSAVMVATRPPDRSGQQTRTALKRYSRPSGSA